MKHLKKSLAGAVKAARSSVKELNQEMNDSKARYAKIEQRVLDLDMKALRKGLSKSEEKELNSSAPELDRLDRRLNSLECRIEDANSLVNNLEQISTDLIRAIKNANKK